MQLTILGSGGGLGIPNPFCQCRHCEAARQDGGKSLRNAPSVLINDDLLIDCGPDVVNSMRQQALDLTGLRTLVITHRHSDHLDPWFFWARCGVKNTDLPLLTVYAPQSVIEHVMRFFKLVMNINQTQLQEQSHTAWRVIKPGVMKLAGRYRVRFFPANHQVSGGSNDTDVVLVAVQDATAHYFHGYDTGPFTDEMWAALANHRFDAVTLDSCIFTQADYVTPYHMTAEQVIATVQRLKDERMLNRGAVIMATHFVHQAVGLHAEPAEYYEPHGITAAYDGLTLSLGNSIKS